MAMHKIDYTVVRTGSRLFDSVMIQAAEHICAELHGIRCEIGAKEIRILGALDDTDYAAYEKFMFGEDACVGS